ncbi:SHOCT domain-containing protein [Ornithinimicrobium sp. Arc0846-15]|nr:SHOCT domain-containing protein [Ornithinimicrobium laminariae]
MRRRIGRPGLLGVAARTAVVAGTARGVTGAMDRSAQSRAQQAADAQAYQAQQRAQPAPPQAPPAAPPTAAPADDMLNALERLAALRAQGILTDEEFAQQKARILGN